MDLEGDETSLGICWAAAASFLEWEGHRGGRGWVGPKSLRWGWGAVSFPVGTELKIDSFGKAGS